MSKTVENWQIFGIISGFCAIYSLFLPFRITRSIHTMTVEESGYALIQSNFMTLINYALEASIVETPVQYVLNYVVLIAMIFGIISIIILLISSISGNIVISILSSIIYIPFVLYLIYNSVTNPIVMSFTTGYYIVLSSLIAAILMPIVYSKSN